MLSILAGFLRWRIKTKIAFAFGVISTITVAVSAAAVVGSRRSGELATRTYDETVVTTAYARAASSDFSSMRAELAHGLMASPATRSKARDNVETLHRSFLQDLATAVSASSSEAVGTVAADLRRVEGEWMAMARSLDDHFRPELWDAAELKAHVTERGIDDMVARVSRAGFDYRTVARATVAHDIQAAVVGAGVAILISGLVAWILSSRISGPLGAASRFAGEIASGRFDSDPPSVTSDEIGDLTASMVTMRDDLRGLIQHQTVLQEQSQARVAEALDGSSEGVVIVQADGVVQLANARALDFLGLPAGRSLSGLSKAALAKQLARPGDDRSPLVMMAGEGPESEEFLLADGRWVRNSRNRTAEGGMVALYTDVTEARARRDQLAAALANLDGAMANMSQGLAVFSADGTLGLANPQFYHLVGIDAEAHGPGTPLDALVGSILGSLGVGASAAARRTRHEDKVLKRGRAFVRSLVLGDAVLSVHYAPMPEGGCLTTVENVTEKRRIDERIHFLATHDALTRLPNRTLFQLRVEDALARARRGKAFAIQYLDLDRFKQVNDTLGHAVGDEVLQQATARLLACVRDTDTVARLGGDEFAILQADIDGTPDCDALAQRVIASLSAPYLVDGQDVSIGTSIGIALSPAHGVDYGTLLRSADTALYKSKDDGRGTWRFFAEALNQKLVLRRELERDLRAALIASEFELHYQPLMDTATRTVCGFEALLRWNHPVRGRIPPTEFIPVAEDTGLIREIGAWVMNTACREAAAWSLPVRIAVNVSAVQLRESTFVQSVQDCLSASGLVAGRLEIEITETVLMADPETTAAVLRELRSLGLSIAMDDFGTGHSSLASLHAFPFGKIKIDRSFIRDLGDRRGADQIVRAVVMLGKTLDMRVTAEGVETQPQLDFLCDAACDEIQGYLIGRPMPGSQVAAFLATSPSPLSRAA